MTWGRKSRLGVCALAAASLAVGLAAPAAAAPPGVDEYELNVPDAGGGSTEPTEPAPTEPAPAPAAPAPTYPTTTTEPTVVAPTVAAPETPDPQRKIVPADTSVNATLGPQEVPPLKVRAADEGDGVAWTTIGLAALVALGCVVAIWRLRFLRELPAAPARRPATGATSGS